VSFARRLRLGGNASLGVACGWGRMSAREIFDRRALLDVRFGPGEVLHDPRSRFVC
jgi:hypothetical protein